MYLPGLWLQQGLRTTKNMPIIVASVYELEWHNISLVKKRVKTIGPVNSRMLTCPTTPKIITLLQQVPCKFHSALYSFSSFVHAGTFPDCQPCHECFQQWYTIINGIADRVSILMIQIESLTTFNYGSNTVESIKSKFSTLLVPLEMANQTFSNTTLQATDHGAL